ncbi:hypothetical protein LCM28_19105 [Salipiger pacificus]|nr:hypothetical protein [Alloyangia pacifica]
MQSKHEMTDGWTNLRKIFDDKPISSTDWNEASTRFHFIDRLLTECLGWEKPYMDVEFPDGDGGRADYILGRPGKAVLEAKREAINFGDLPIGKPSTVRKISPLVAASPNLDAAMKQALGYCSLLGIPLAIVANGPQILIFQSQTNYPPLEGECFFINGYEQIIDNFPLLWRLLSPEGVAENRAQREISLHRTPRMPPKASEFIVEPEQYRYRNAFQEEIQSISTLLLEDLEDAKELKSAFYRDCYVADEANSRHLLLSKKVISARYKRATADGKSPSAFELVLDKRRGKQAKIVDPSALGAATSRPIVVLGDVGVGKTSFFENLYYSLDNDQRSSTIFIHINLGLKGTLTEDVRSSILREIPRGIKEGANIDINAVDFCERVYEDELKSFDDSPEGMFKDALPDDYMRSKVKFVSNLIAERDRHLLRSLQYISQVRRKLIILIIDNADQRKFDVQQDAFLIAQELAGADAGLVFVALRPSTYFESKSKGAMSAYKNKVLTISPPPADDVIQRRIAFAIRVAEGKEDHKNLSGIRMYIESVVSLLRATLRSIKSNGEIRQFLANITGGNTRSVVELITTFFGSPNVDSQKIVRIEEETGDYKVPLHEFTKHALLGEYAYYHPQSSPYAFNIFDVNTPDPKEHFLSSFIVSCLTSNSTLRDSDGFVYGEALMKEMQGLGFTEEQVRPSLRKLAEKRLIETPHSHYREIGVAPDILPDYFHFRATSIGAYHTKSWAGRFEFLDATSSDTPIFHEETRDKVVG